MPFSWKQISARKCVCSMLLVYCNQLKTPSINARRSIKMCALNSNRAPKLNHKDYIQCQKSGYFAVQYRWIMFYSLTNVTRFSIRFNWAWTRRVECAQMRQFVWCIKQKCNFRLKSSYFIKMNKYLSTNSNYSQKADQA